MGVRGKFSRHSPAHVHTCLKYSTDSSRSPQSVVETIRNFARCWRPRARPHARLSVDVRTCVAGVVVPACGHSREERTFRVPIWIRFLEDDFFKINLLSAVSVSSRRRLARTAYAVFCPRRGRSRRTIANTCGYFCLARRHVCHGKRPVFR